LATPRILVINPNSSVEVTKAIDQGVDSLRPWLNFEIVTTTLTEGPPGIETQAHVESVVQPTARLMQANPADAYVIACFSDPGIALARESVPVPVVGIAEASMLLALGLGYRFGIIAILDASVRRHLGYVRMLGLEHRLAGDRAINLGVRDAGDTAAIERIVSVGRKLRDDDGADVLILGCAGMGHRRDILEQELGVPVIDPSQAAVLRAASLLTLGYRRAN
jgi:Asp/Glu/hydantoin racemase